MMSVPGSTMLWTLKSTDALKKSKALLSDKKLFRFDDDEFLDEEQSEVFGRGSNRNTESDRYIVLVIIGLSLLGLTNLFACSQ